MKGLSECKASESNIRRIQVKDIVKEVEDYLKIYLSAGMDISCIIISCLPNDVMKSVIKCKNAKEMWNDLILAHEGPSDTRDTKIAALRLKYNAFKSLEGEKDNDSDIKEDQRTSNEFMADLNDEYHERALLANQKRFYKSYQKDYRGKYKGLKAEMVVLTKRIDDLTKGESEKGKSDKGLIADSFNWDDEFVSSEDEGVTKIRAFMEIAEDELSVGKADARSGQWVDITMKKVHRLLSMTDGDDRKHVLDYTHVDLIYVEDQRKNMVSKYNLLKQELSLHKSELLPGNIVKALGGRGRRKEKISTKEIVFSKANESSSEPIPEITSDSESDCEA
ncbi:hypothetical protein Tco_1030739 [Tanacetum coccineum]|uniref:Retrovirus-related Pol polyprotein from transposon TNT 1-94 n=1 Tax=Tanacetum coccineum TaxID=301880 RepID=A0ABQ5G8P3_9ASTR